VVEVTGDDLNKLKELSLEVAKLLNQTPKVVDVDIMADDIFKKFELIPDKEKIARSGLNVEQVNKIIYLAFEGMAIAHKNSKNEDGQIDIFLSLDDKTKRFDSRTKEALESKLSSMQLMNQKGMLVPVKEVVEIREVNSNPMIMHKDPQQAYKCYCRNR